MNIETRLDNLEKLVYSFIKNQSQKDEYNKYDVEGCKNDIEVITPFSESKKAYINDEYCVFDTSKKGAITCSCITDSGIGIPTSYTVSNNSVTVSFNKLDEVATVSINIQ